MAHIQLEMSQELNADLRDVDNWPLLSKPKQSNVGFNGVCGSKLWCQVI